ncbi:hypothetical protein U9M48_013342 [Paspalum notatum var. saurae]|uniref:Uncharacterized protein n=1 Tax=Paspalum notatum var. saurae TaxID=547442 RepID=A0AAQ3SZA5_PASNO
MGFLVPGTGEMGFQVVVFCPKQAILVLARLPGPVPNPAGRGRIRATRGWISVDRGSKATRHLQCPVAYLSRPQRIQPAARVEGSFEAAYRGSSAGQTEPMARALGAITP